ncbi:MAG: histidine--tRNA ligase [Proteobacteria bacterium]|jgi:histidyl-tRNA synthetase|nr:histidine--tRNA ligase [Pseudomonadota bacterium]MDA0942093.1 histidine--tRNA ligase [Pseudomonadota bacterium]
MKKYQSIKGFYDVLPEQQKYWRFFYEKAYQILDRYAYQEIKLPLVESTDLYIHSVGQQTDIVEKEMYSWQDSLNQDRLTLRPEGTAGCVRAVIENNLTYNGPIRLFYHGPMFRHENVQKGRQRQFNQLGIEAFGFPEPLVDAEMICLLHDFWKELGLKNIELHINNIGDPNERSEYRKQLIKYFEQHKDQLDEDASRRLHSNPMRILDSKNPKMQSIIDHAPKFVDGMSGASKTHFEKVLGYLEQQNIPYTINKNLVRGLDYYNRTVFEWVSNDLGSQGTVAGGGRYDYLIGSMCNTEIPAFGVGIGIERIILLLEQLDHVQNYSQPSVYLVNMGPSVDEFTLQVANVLRNQGISTSMNIGSTSFKSQLKKADKSGASFAIIIGDDEVKKKVVQIKLLRKTMDQQEVLLNNIVDFIKNNAH